jgi:uncharacterized membrane protein YgdD (TMEM256/DUF423 family)
MAGYERATGCLAAILGGLAVAAGAYAAHGLGGDERAAGLLATAAQYAVWHVLATFVALARGGPGRIAAALFLLGVLLFAGSLGQLALLGATPLTAAAPVGGICLLSGWCVLALAWLRPSWPRG